MSSDRYFEHSISDAPYRLPLELWQSGVSRIVEQLMRHEAHKFTVYTGSAGVAYALLRLVTCRAVRFPIGDGQQISREAVWDAILRKIAEAIVNVRPHVRGRSGWPFLCGNAGVYVTGALIFHEAATGASAPEAVQNHELFVELRSDPEQQRDEAIRVVMNLGTPLMSLSGSRRDAPEDEVLYGRAGYLLGNLHLRQIPSQHPDNSASIVRALLLSGKTQSQRRRHPCPLYYEWPHDHPKPYLGAAHGLMGILYVLLHFTEVLQAFGELPTVIQAIQYVLQCEVDQHGRSGRHGYYPSSLQSHRPPLVHWCHGSCGAVFLFAKAYEVLQDVEMLQAAMRAGEVLWNKGLLKKGPGLCHGVSGNGYALLKLYKVTGDQKYLTRASRFAEFIFSETFQSARVPDSPWSLYEGWAGALCFLLDLKDPLNSAFPLFEP